jgi:anti-anti-sigma factor
MAFDYLIERTEDFVVVDMNGRLMDKLEAVGISVDIEDELNAGRSRFLVDLTDLEYMNSTGLNILINLVNKARENGGKVVISGASQRITALFNVTKLNTIFNLATSREEAFALFGESGKA